MKLEYQKISFTHIDFAKIIALNLELFPKNELVAPINLSNNIYANDEMGDKMEKIYNFRDPKNLLKNIDKGKRSIFFR